MNNRDTAILAIGCLITAVTTYLIRDHKIERDYDHLEDNARKVVTAAELQEWATNLLAANPRGTNLVPTNWGKSFPKQLIRLCPRIGPGVGIFPSDDTNSPPH